VDDKLVVIARYLGKADAPYSIKLAVLKAVAKFLSGGSSEEAVKLSLAVLLRFAYNPNWWIERHILRLLGFKVEYPPPRFSRPVVAEMTEEVKSLLKDAGVVSE